MMTPELKAARKASRDFEKRMSKLIPVADFVKVLGRDELVSIKVDCIELVGKVEFVNDALEKLGYRPVRLTRNMLNPNSNWFAIDINTPAYLDPGCESYHSM